jgi:pimeloyl-ACP methyl ester carboxylesterase
MGRIREDGFLTLNGLAQWVMIGGEDVANPPLVMLHGGPGMTETGFFRRYNRSLEKDFTVVYWDQRGAGKSFRSGIPLSTMTCEQFIADLDALVDAVRSKLGKDQVVLFGHSWGSALGVLYAARFPEKVALYAGCGQLGDWQAAERAAYAFTVDEARRRNDRRAIDELNRIGPRRTKARSSGPSDCGWRGSLERRTSGRRSGCCSPSTRSSCRASTGAFASH